MEELSRAFMMSDECGGWRFGRREASLHDYILHLLIIVLACYVHVPKREPCMLIVTSHEISHTALSN